MTQIDLLLSRRDVRNIYSLRFITLFPFLLTLLASPTNMGVHENSSNDTTETLLLAHIEESPEHKIPKDAFNFAYVIYFILGAGALLPWNAFIIAVDYFSYLYPGKRVDRTFAVVYKPMTLIFLLLIIFSPKKPRAYIRINTGLGLFMLALLGVPLIDVFYIKGQSELYGGFYLTVGAVGLAALADALVQGGIFGSAGEMPKRYMQALVAGTSASGVLATSLRILTKAAFPQDAHGLRISAILYFVVAIVLMTLCLVLYNVLQRLPVVKYYQQLKKQAVSEDKKLSSSTSLAVWETILEIKQYGAGILIIFIVTLSIMPGFLAEDLHSEALGSWYPLLLIGCFDTFDLAGKVMTSIYLVKNANVAIVGSVARLLFYPLYLWCMRGSQLFPTEVAATLLTCLFGFTDGYFSSTLLIMAPKAVQLQHAETAGLLSVLCISGGLAAGSIASWLWLSFL